MKRFITHIKESSFGAADGVESNPQPHKVDEAESGPTRMEIQKRLDALRKTTDSRHKAIIQVEREFGVRLTVSNDGQIVNFRSGQNESKEVREGEEKFTVKITRDTGRVSKLSGQSAEEVAKLKKSYEGSGTEIEVTNESLRNVELKHLYGLEVGDKIRTKLGGQIPGIITKIEHDKVYFDHETDKYNSDLSGAKGRLKTFVTSIRNVVKESRTQAKARLIIESLIDAQDLEAEALLIAYNNFPKEYGNKDITGLLARVKEYFTKQVQSDLKDEIEDVLQTVKKELTSYWRRESKLREAADPIDVLISKLHALTGKIIKRDAAKAIISIEGEDLPEDEALEKMVKQLKITI